MLEQKFVLDNFYIAGELFAINYLLIVVLTYQAPSANATVLCREDTLTLRKGCHASRPHRVYLDCASAAPCLRLRTMATIPGSAGRRGVRRPGAARYMERNQERRMENRRTWSGLELACR